MQKHIHQPTRKVLGYEIRKQLHGRFRVVEFYQTPDGCVHKRSYKKNLLYTDADELVYNLEKKLKH